jgi:hypothetical protein
LRMTPRASNCDEYLINKSNLAHSIVHSRIGRKVANINVMHSVGNFKITSTTLSRIIC